MMHVSVYTGMKNVVPCLFGFQSTNPSWLPWTLRISRLVKTNEYPTHTQSHLYWDKANHHG